MLFSEELNTVENNENAELRKYGPVKNIDFEVFKPHIEWAETKYVLPVLGETLHTNLTEYYNGSSSSSSSTADVFSDLLTRAQQALFNISLSKFVKVGAFHLSDAGVTKLSGENNTPANYPEVEALAQHYMDTGLEQLDDLSIWLNANADSFTLDETHTNEGLFIQTAVEFSNIIDINNSARTYSALKAVMNKVQYQYLRRELTIDFYNEILAYINSEESSSASTANETAIDELITTLKKAVAHLTIARLPESLTFKIEAQSLSLAEPVGKTILDKLQAQRPLIAAKKKEAEADGHAYLNDAILYL
ncbi:MAG: DUF6712 family protein, partial [Pseudoalteromonas tetraodonis]